MINPIEHSKTKELAGKYKVEPYVVAADIYGHESLAGRGGWTWYTGSSSWMLKAGIEYILGIKIEDNTLRVEPCITNEWKEYKVRYRFKSSIYNIKVQKIQNQDMNSTTSNNIKSFKVNGYEIDDKCVKLIDDGKIYDIEVLY